MANKTIPLKEAGSHSYHQICKKVCKFYGVKDAELWFQSNKKMILDLCKKDILGITKDNSLFDYVARKQLERKFRDVNHG